MKTTDLIQKAMTSNLCPAEIRALVSAIHNREGDVYDLLLALGRTGNADHRAVVEPFLHHQEDPMLARLALQILCHYWSLSDQYLQSLVTLAKGVDWDEDEDVRLMALDCLGQHLAKHPDNAILRYLYSTYCDKTERPIVRESAYCSMALAVGRSPIDLPSPAKRFDLRTEIDETVLKEVREAMLLD